MAKPIRVKLIYRNYRPLHSMFSTFIESPPAGVTFEIPPAKRHKGIFLVLYRIYNKFGDVRLLRWFLSAVVDPLVFGTSSKASTDKDIDIYHYLNLIPASDPNKPFIVEFEHVGALYGFVDDKKQIDKVRRTLMSSNCKTVICSTQAAKRTLKNLMQGQYAKVSAKAEVVYPAVSPSHIFRRQDQRQNHNKLKLLFVGNLCYLKGLQELLMALGDIPEIADKVHLTVISNDAGDLIEQYPDLKPAIDYYPPQFSKADIIEKFYSKSDLFVLPTKRDTFGFALLDALCCGLPVISTKQYAIPEIIDDKKDGLLADLETPFLDNTMFITRALAESSTRPNPNSYLADQVRTLLEGFLDGKYDIAKLSQNAYKKVEPGGRFSVKNRNQKLLKIYKNALKAY